MKRKFECWNCKKHFEADDKEWVECPHCHSDNVEYASFHMPKWTLWCVLGAAVLGGVGIALSQIDWKTEKTRADLNTEDSVAVEEFVVDSTFTSETGLEIPSSIIVGELTFEEDGYTFEAEVKNPPSLKFYYAVLEAFEDKVVAKSNDGKFSAIPFSNAEGGSYRVQILAIGTDSVCASADVPGFIKQKKVSKKMTVAELQTKITKRDPSLMGLGENDYLAPDYKLKFTGLPKDATNVPQVLAEVYDKLDMGTWTSAKVTSLEYDDMNRVSQITMKVVTDDFDF